MKAYYLGHAIAEKKSNMGRAVEMTDAAISALQVKHDETSKLRLLFYILLKAEILRSTRQVTDLRGKAKELSQEIDSEIYNDYMAVEETTQTRKKAYGLQTGVIADRGVQSTVSYSISDGFNVLSVHYDAACRTLGVDERSLSDKEINFLRKVSLKEMLEHHGISFPL